MKTQGKDYLQKERNSWMTWICPIIFKIWKMHFSKFSQNKSWNQWASNNWNNLQIIQEMLYKYTIKTAWIFLHLLNPGLRPMFSETSEGGKTWSSPSNLPCWELSDQVFLQKNYRRISWKFCFSSDVENLWLPLLDTIL